MICATAPTSNMLTFKVPNAVEVQCSVGSSLSASVLAWATAEGRYKLEKNTGGWPGAAPGPCSPPRPPAVAALRPPTSAPRHQTPDRSGCPSAVRGAGFAVAGSELGACAQRWNGADHASALAIAAIIIECFIFQTPISRFALQPLTDFPAA